MALLYVITLERELADAGAAAAYAKSKAGKALARESDRIDSAARRRSVTQLTAFLSESQAALIAQLKEEGFDPANMRLPPEAWFDPAEGLKSVRKLTEHVHGALNDFKQPNPILRDLGAVEAILVAAQAEGVRFHLSKAVG